VKAVKVIFISGPFRAPTELKRRENIRRAELAALSVWQSGAAAICPHLNTAHFDGSLPDEVFLNGDLSILAKCDAILMLDDWKRSAGATAERDFALSIGMMVLNDLNELAEWVKANDEDLHED
jgi:hypothetical protein